MRLTLELLHTHLQMKLYVWSRVRVLFPNMYRYELHKHAKATLGSGNLRLAVQLPGLLFSHVVFFDEIFQLWLSF